MPAAHPGNMFAFLMRRLAKWLSPDRPATCAQGHLCGAALQTGAVTSSRLQQQSSGAFEAEICCHQGRGSIGGTLIEGSQGVRAWGGLPSGVPVQFCAAGPCHWQPVCMLSLGRHAR